MIFVSGKPTSLITGLTEADGLQLIEIPFSQGLAGVYIPTEFTPTDYPGIVTEKHVETVAVGAILAVYDNFAKNSDRYRNLVSFSRDLVANVAAFKRSPRHPKWQELDLGAEVPGWKRFGPMKDILNGVKTTGGRTLREIMENQKN
jgi:hypothetical protein